MHFQITSARPRRGSPHRASNHSSGNGITGHLKQRRTLEKAARFEPASTRTTQLYDRWHDEVSLDEVERIVI